MMQVTAYKDMTGKLHADRRDAAEADFAWMVGQAWRAMPASGDTGDPTIIARYLARNRSAFVKLRDAIREFDGDSEISLTAADGTREGGA